VSPNRLRLGGRAGLGT